MSSELNGIYPNMDHLGPTEMCQHPNIQTPSSGGLYCPDCGKCFEHSELVNEMEPPTSYTPDRSRFAHRPGETEYEYYCRLFPAYDPRD